MSVKEKENYLTHQRPKPKGQRKSPPESWTQTPFLPFLPPTTAQRPHTSRSRLHLGGPILPPRRIPSVLRALLLPSVLPHLPSRRHLRPPAPMCELRPPPRHIVRRSRPRVLRCAMNSWGVRSESAHSTHRRKQAHNSRGVRSAVEVRPLHASTHAARDRKSLQPK